MNPEQLTSRFEETFSKGAPAGVCQVPGRVNLIGEHVDYSGLSVLPMAIDRYIWAAYRRRTDREIHVATDDSSYPASTFDASGSIESAASGHWSNYVRAAIQALINEMEISDAQGMDLFVASNLPAGSGLSSSTALVVATALAYLACSERALDDSADRKKLAGILAKSERYVGTQSGGMDHAAILLGQEGHALKIDFDPLRYDPIPIPADCAIVVCNSGVIANKGGHAQADYNRGPALCGFIRAMVEHHAQQEFGGELEFATLGEIWSGPLCLTHSEAADLFEAAIAKDRYSISELAALLGLDDNAIRELWSTELAEPDNGLPLRAWSRHQYQEQRRVERTRDALLSNDAAAAGQLMLESHASCSDGLGVSTPELDALVQTAITNGAHGARLTGAGFGGCTVNLVPKAQVATFRDAIWTHYYTEGPGKTTDFTNAEDAIFEVAPSSGAEYQ